MFVAGVRVVEFGSNAAVNLECLLRSIQKRCASCTCVWHTRAQCASRLCRVHRQAASSERCRSISSRNMSRRWSSDVQTTRPSRRTPEMHIKLPPPHHRSTCLSVSTNERDTMMIRTRADLALSSRTNHRRVRHDMRYDCTRLTCD